jgi:hypothetical protein
LGGEVKVLLLVLQEQGWIDPTMLTNRYLPEKGSNAFGIINLYTSLLDLTSI